MKKLIVSISIILGFGSVVANSFAADQGLENCIQSVKKEKAGEFVKLEKLNVSGKASYELELRDINRNDWEFTCDADNGKISERETEVANPNSQAFKKNVKVTEEDAVAIALKAYPGKVQEVEYEVEDNGASSYEFDIVNDKGVQTKLEVDAATGKIIETAIEEWEIGQEPEQSR